MPLSLLGTDAAFIPMEKEPKIANLYRTTRRISDFKMPVTIRYGSFVRRSELNQAFFSAGNSTHLMPGPRICAPLMTAQIAGTPLQLLSELSQESLITSSKASQKLDSSCRVDG
jgi:hypothetical protein